MRLHSDAMASSTTSSVTSKHNNTPVTSASVTPICNPALSYPSCSGRGANISRAVAISLIFANCLRDYLGRYYKLVIYNSSLGGFCFGRFGILRSSFALVGNKSKLLFTRLCELLALFLHLFDICSVAMPASRHHQYQKSTKNKTQNRRDLISRTSLTRKHIYERT